MKKGIIFLFIINIYGIIISQTPQTDPHWIMNNIFSDEFNGSRKSIWQNYGLYDSLGSAIHRPQNIQYGIETESGRNFLRFIAEVENGTIYSGGIRTGLEFGGYLGLGYGYYEIEARVLQTPNIVSGLWPAFWTQHSYKPTNSPPYWYEEIDIFEPCNCQVRANEHEVGYHRRLNDYDSASINIDPEKHKKTKYNVDMSLWHKYAIEWLPERLTFYCDDEAFAVIGPDTLTPYHQNTNLWIDLQTDLDTGGYCPPDIIEGILGYFDVNYFRYYQLSCDSVDINEILDYNTYNYTMKKSITLSGASSLISGENISLRATDFIKLDVGFEVPIGAELYLDIHPAPCDN